jgi:hypothetical protein
MADVAQLGRAFKQIHPEYADVADEALGRAVKTKYPGSYDDVQDPQKAQLAKNDRMIQSMEPQQDQGFLPTLWNGVKSLPSSAMEFLSGHPMQSMYNAAGEQAGATKEALGRNDYSSAIGHTLGGVLAPLGGAQAVQAGEEIGGGQPQQGAAHALEVLAPYTAHGISELPLQSPVTKGPGKFVKPWSPSSVLNMVLPPKLKALINAVGGENELKPAGTLRRLQFRSPLDLGEKGLPPIWEGQEPMGTPATPDLTPIQNTSGVLPSGRVPGSGTPKPPRAPNTQPPIWDGLDLRGRPNLPDATSIPNVSGVLPSGRVPGSGVSKPPPMPSIHTPVWAGQDLRIKPETLDLTPIAPAPGPYPIRRPPEPVVAQPTTSPVQPKSPIPPVGEAMSQNTVMSGPEAHRYAHAQAQAAELPGSPSGSRAGAHTALTAIAKAKYGKNAWHELAPTQMQEIGDWLLDINMQKARAAGNVPPVK